MRSPLSAAFFSLLVAALGAGCARPPTGSGPAPSASAAADAPAIAFEGTSHDFGKVMEGEVARHVFKLKNTGRSPLEISNVRSSCGCTAAVLNTKTIPPGGSGEIEVKFDTKNRRGKSEKTITVTSNDPAQKTTTLKISAEVESLLAFDPTYTFFDTPVGEKATKESFIGGKLANDAKLRITKVEPQEQQGQAPSGPLPVQVELVEKQDGGAVRRGLRIRMEPRQVGPGAARVILATGLEKPSELEHMVRWNVRGNLQVPRTVFLDLAKPALKQRSVRVTSRAPDFVLRAARVTEGPFKAEIAKADAGTGYDVLVTTTLAAPAAQVTKGKLILESNDKLEPRKEVLITLGAAAPAGARPAPGAPAR